MDDAYPKEWLQEQEQECPKIVPCCCVDAPMCMIAPKRDIKEARRGYPKEIHLPDFAVTERELEDMYKAVKVGIKTHDQPKWTLHRIGAKLRHMIKGPFRYECLPCQLKVAVDYAFELLDFESLHNECYWSPLVERGKEQLIAAANPSQKNYHHSAWSSAKAAIAHAPQLKLSYTCGQCGGVLNYSVSKKAYLCKAQHLNSVPDSIDGERLAVQMTDLNHDLAKYHKQMD